MNSPTSLDGNFRNSTPKQSVAVLTSSPAQRSRDQENMAPNSYRLGTGRIGTHWGKRPGPVGQLAAASSRLILGVGLLLAGTWAEAANLLVNPGFEQNSQHVVPNGWTRFAPPTAQSFGNYWVEVSNATVSAQSGLQYFKEWGASYNGINNAAGIYQDLSSAPGSTYQASGWFYTSGDTLGPDCYVWIDVQFLGGGGNLLALYKSANFTASVGLFNWFQYQVTNACDISSPVSIGDPYFNTYAVTGAVNQLVAPPGTAKVRYRFVYVQFASEGGSCYFDSAVLDQVSGSIPPAINNLFPLNMIFVNPNDGISFNVNSPNGNTINNSGIGLVLNGANVSSSLAISGSSSNKTVAYHGLQSNTVYTASITVTDAFNLTASANTYFETTWVGVPPVVYLWEAEDFDFTNGMYHDFPTLCNTVGTSNCYFGTVGVEGVDEHNVGSAPNHQYRADDAVGTLVSGDYARPDHWRAGVSDYRIDPLIQGMWLNYTRDWSNGSYYVIGRLSTDIGLSGTLTLSVVNPDTSTTDLGTFTINGGQGWSAFQNVFMQDTNGNNAVITLSGKKTLHLTSGGNLLPTFFMLAVGQADLPILTGMYPSGSHPFEPTNALSFNVTTLGSTFPSNGIGLNLDGIDVSSNLVLAGSASTKSVVYPNLLSNALHVAVITVTNALGHGITITNRFDTFSQDDYMVETEDFDYGGGQFVASWFPDAYSDFNLPAQAVTNIDFQHISLPGEVFNYRSVGIPQDVSHDYPRQVFVGSFATDYILVFFAGTDWASYTRDYPAGSYYAYIRTSGSGPFSMYLDQVVSGAGTASQVTRRLGHFGGIGKNYATYGWVPLTDDGLAAPSVIKLGGVATLRLTTAGNCNPNFIMLVPAQGITLSVSLSASKRVLSFPTQAGVTYRLFYKNELSSGSWTLLTTVVGTGSVVSVNDLTTDTRRFYKLTTP